MAFSLDHPPTYPSEKDYWHYDVAAVYALDIIEELLNNKHPTGVIANVNFPNVPRDQVKGMKLTMQGKRHINSITF